jgi:hypothetical protein
LCSLPAFALADEPSIQPAIDAARKREERFKTVSIEWKVTTFVPKGGRMEADPAGLPLPRAAQTVESTHGLVFDGQRYRVESSDPGFRLQLPSSSDGVDTFDGERTFLRFYPNGRVQPAQLVIERAGAQRGFGNVALLPLTLWCRGTSSELLQETPRRLRIVSQSEIDGRLHVEIRVDGPAGVSPTIYFSNPASDYLIRRISSKSKGALEVTDVDYREQPEVGWVPSGWTTVKTRNGGRLAHRIRAEVTDVRVNEAIAASTFRLEPVPGESVTNNDEHKHYRVRADGTLEEQNEGAQSAPPVSPAPVPSPSWPGRTLVRYVLLPGLLLAVIGFMILRRRRRPHTPST